MKMVVRVDVRVDVSKVVLVVVIPIVKKAVKITVKLAVRPLPQVHMMVVEEVAKVNVMVDVKERVMATAMVAANPLVIKVGDPYFEL